MFDEVNDICRNEESALRMVIVSPVRLYREGLAAALSTLGGIGEIVTCEHSTDGLRLAHQLAPDILLLDMSGIGSSAAARLFIKEWSTLKIIAVALPETAQRVVACAEAGVAGYVPCDGSIEDLIAVVGHVIRGETLCSPVIAAGLMHRVADLAYDNRLPRSPARLTARELEVADHIALGLSNRAIATRLGIELCTVKNHVHHILEKLGETRRANIAHHLGV